MIAGRHFDTQTIASEERKFLEAYYDGDDPLLAEGIFYYRSLFRKYLLRKADKAFGRLPEKEQEEIFDKAEARFRAAMTYSFNKGHQTAFAILLRETASQTIYDEKYFSNPEAVGTFLHTLDRSMSKEVFEDNVRRADVDVLINFIRRNFENTYDVVMDYVKVFFKKGVIVAFDQIRREIVGVEPNITGYSRMLNAPLNQSFQVTPSFNASFVVESPNYEEWELFWDYTYSEYIGNNLLGKILIHKFNAKTIRSYSEAQALAYQFFERFVPQNSEPDEDYYMVDIAFLLISPTETARIPDKFEYQSIKASIATFICQRLGVSPDRVVIVN